jgi:UDP-N-acetylmuramoyl-tripeptide--D-alanyl-D-alanine ligase
MTIEALHELFLKSDGVCTDTRKLRPNSMFFALRGDTFNGNEFASKAIEAGCNWAVIDDATAIGSKSDKAILVDDVQKTLQQLANFHRRQFKIPVLAITGSNGKTTSKELIAAVLSKKYSVLFTEGNLNNHLGVPFTLLRMTKEHEIAIIEMGASKPGDIRELCEIAEPTAGIITNIGLAHIEGFGSPEAVVETKTELYRFLLSNKGSIIFNADDKVLRAHIPSDWSCWSYGVNDGDIRGELVKLDPFVNFMWKSAGLSSPVLKTNLVGKYNFTNFLLAAAVGNYFDVAPDQINNALTGYKPSNNRSQITQTDRNTLIVDCYNANGSSMMAALESFKEIEHPSKIAILGDMLELGKISEETHLKVIDFLKKNEMKAILTGKIFSGLNSGFSSYPDSASLIASENLGNIKNSLVLLKGSRGLKLEGLITYL